MDYGASAASSGARLTTGGTVSLMDACQVCEQPLPRPDHQEPHDLAAGLVAAHDHPLANVGAHGHLGFSDREVENVGLFYRMYVPSSCLVRIYSPDPPIPLDQRTITPRDRPLSPDWPVPLVHST